MRVDQPLYAMDLPGGFHLEELEGADRWSSGAHLLLPYPANPVPPGTSAHDPSFRAAIPATLPPGLL